jgi:2-polyprenyl-3-methyl-5-hydroxy-6-metoxy-1,4-benzoquinol methylase
MSTPTIPRLPEIPLDDFDAEYRRAEIEGQSLLDDMISAFEIVAGQVPLPSFDFFRGGHRTVLDVGCGIGTLPFLLAEHNPNAKVIGVDLSEESIAYAKINFEPRATNLSYQVGSVEDISEMFQDVDMITCVGALHHFPSLDDAINNIMTTLSDDGVFFLNDLNRKNIYKHFSAKELIDLDEIRKLPEKARIKELRRQGYTKGEKMQRFLALMSFQAAYTPEELSAALGEKYRFKGKLASFNYVFGVYKLSAIMGQYGHG